MIVTKLLIASLGYIQTTFVKLSSSIQVANSTFNKGVLMNAGFQAASEDDDYDCFIFHDVDMIPENARNLYSCNDARPRHLSPAVDTFSYKSVSSSPNYVSQNRSSMPQATG